MIKILFHIDTLVGGGAEKVLCNLVNHMDHSIFDITVQTVYPDDAAKYLADGIHYKSIYPSKNKFYQTLYRVEAVLGLIYPLHMKDDYDIEVAYLEFGPTKVIASSTNKKAKKIAWVHCDFEDEIKNKEAYVIKTSAIYRRFNKIVCVSDKCRESFVSMFGNDPEVTVIHNVVDDNEIITKADQPLSSGADKRKFTLCMVGSFVPGRNYLRLLNTVYRLHKENYDFELWILGDGKQRSELEDFIIEHEMTSYVSLFGFQMNPYPFIKAADLLVYSSNSEGFSTFITEGVILEKTIITTDCAGMHELLDNYNNGFITENDDESFYQGVKRLLDNYPKGKGNNIEFSTEQLTQDNEELFLSMVSE